MRDREGTSVTPEFGAPVLDLIHGRTADVAPSAPPYCADSTDPIVGQVVKMSLQSDVGVDSTHVLRTEAVVESTRVTAPRGMLDAMSMGFRLIVDRITGTAARPTLKENAVNVIVESLEVPAPRGSPERGARRGLIAALVRRFGGMA